MFTSPSVEQYAKPNIYVKCTSLNVADKFVYLVITLFQYGSLDAEIYSHLNM